MNEPSMETVAPQEAPRRERPILFSGPMVRALLAGKKTQTRRVVKLPEWFQDEYMRYGAADIRAELDCPYGKAGDRLWVRETHWLAPAGFGDEPKNAPVDANGCPRTIGYDASMDDDSRRCATDYAVKRSPSIFMPRWASRLTLEVTAVRAERLHAITEHDARREGVERGRNASAPVNETQTYRDGFCLAWDHINGKRAPWDSNPWVWVVSFAVSGVAR